MISLFLFFRCLILNTGYQLLRLINRQSNGVLGTDLGARTNFFTSPWTKCVTMPNLVTVGQPYRRQKGGPEKFGDTEPR